MMERIKKCINIVLQFRNTREVVLLRENGRKCYRDIFEV